MGGAAVRRSSHAFPPTADGVDREAGGVVVDTDTDPAFVAAQVIDSIGDRLALGGDDEVVHLHTLRLSLRSPLAPRILEVADQLFLLRVHRDDRVSLRLMVAHLIIEVGELGIPIRVRGAFLCLAIRLQRVAQVMQQSRNHPGTHRMPHGL